MELEGRRQREKSFGAQNGGINNVTLKADVRHTTTGWQATCTCNADVVPQTVLDPFAGSGTTLAVALKHGRRAIGCELNPEYIELAYRRIGKVQPMLLEMQP
jgi:tRNA/tmRNA/rRNA uracil-C5-methylase (TrmA/RlmC/RlmD family)